MEDYQRQLTDALSETMITEADVLAEFDITNLFDWWAMKQTKRDNNKVELVWMDERGRHRGVYDGDYRVFITDQGTLDEVEFYAMWEDLPDRKSALIAIGTDPKLWRENRDEEQREGTGMGNQKGKKGKLSPVRVISKLLADGTLLEALYDPATGTDALAIREPDGEIRTAKSFKLKNKVFVPVPDEMVRRGIVLLPSKVGELRDEDELLGHIQGFTHAHVDVDETFERIASYYVLFTYLYDNFTALPYLRALGQHGTGKSRFSRTVGSICYRPVLMGGAVSSASIYRMLELYQGTLLIDEADYNHQSETWALILQILNLGYEADAAVIRCDGNGFRPTPYSCYGPKLIASRKPFGDKALDSRCLTAKFYPTQRDDIPLQIPRLIEWEDAREIRNMLLAWRLHRFNPDREHLGYLTGKLVPRLEQIVKPLQAVLTNQNAKRDIETFVQDYASQAQAERSQTLPGLVLRGIVELLEEGQEVYYCAIADKVQPWLENTHYTLTGRKVGILVREELHLEAKTGTQNRAKVKINPDAITHIVKLCPRYGLDGSELGSELGSVRFGENLTRK